MTIPKGLLESALGGSQRGVNPDGYDNRNCLFDSFVFPGIDTGPMNVAAPDMLTPHADEKLRALRRMKAIATGAFVLMTIIFFVTEPLGTGTLVWAIRWDHINAFAEASMVGALADWFAVVALFRHPLGIPIWHTAIIPRKKQEIGRNLGNFVENRLLSVENLSTEIGRFSASTAALGFLESEQNRTRAAGWMVDGVEALVHALDDEKAEQTLSNLLSERLREANVGRLLGNGLDLLVASGKHHQLLDQALHQVAAWLPSRREMVHEFIERSLERMLKWGSRLVPSGVVDRATDQVLTALIELLQEAARDPDHPMRADLNKRAEEWVERLKTDPDWTARIDIWKMELIDHPELRRAVAGLWSDAKAWLVADIESENSTIRRYALRAVESLHQRLSNDEGLRGVMDERLRAAVISLLSTHHHAIGGLIQRVVDSWDAEQLSRELELNLGRDLQYIRLNGTVIGGIVGLVIHLLR